MGIFREKSDKTFDSGKYLLDASHFNPCIHCFYYSCFQLIIDLLKEEYHYTDEQIESGTKESSPHTAIINELKKCLYGSDINSSFLEEFGWLKKMRIKADYSDRNIGENEARKMEQKSIKFREEIQKIYQNES